jgi:hypothetical protein
MSRINHPTKNSIREVKHLGCTYDNTGSSSIGVKMHARIYTSLARDVVTSTIKGYFHIETGSFIKMMGYKSNV